MIDVFSQPGRQTLSEILRTGPLLAFDIDGTLAPIVPRPEDARVPHQVQESLALLAQRAPVAVITGRARADGQRMLEFEPAYIVGNHGAEGVLDWEARTQDFAATVRDWHGVLAESSEIRRLGAWIEDKRYSLSVHYRAHPVDANVAAALADVLHRLRPPPHLIGGKAVFNLLPPGAPRKGEALEALVRESGRTTAIYIGDDETDEDVFRLARSELLTIRVEPSARSAARLFLPRQSEMPALIDLIAREWESENDPQPTALRTRAG